MNRVDPEINFQLSRIEVLGVPTPEEHREDGVTWAAQGHRGDDHNLIVIGYLRRSGEEGYGQAQSVASFLVTSALHDLSDEKLNAWLQAFVVEHLYDICRRALQSQAAAMDFHFDLPLAAPEIEDFTVELANVTEVDEDDA
ncbi:hypothetical protein [Frigoribacterium sp. VKM Ac-2530]|uniref:hypothetical protein n=1 Tax=Frigoribacterium sp. VKM Ac-2530 TaxID=2783822 RepID=UPI00188BB338|nr:hypothetical protein [Frigoribacterium sp. VKM Ac-2530]MBF4578907.1 hypothetical protein [Frigoribacterium sp. VKM Ac-2530]